MKFKEKGFTLIEMMIAVAVLAILSIIALPAYQNYLIRSQVSEGITLFEGKKVSAEEMLAVKESKSFEFTEESLYSQYASVVASGNLQGDDFSVGIIYGNLSHEKISDKFLLFQSKRNDKNNIIWNCFTDLDDKYLPAGMKCNLEDFGIDPNPPTKPSQCDYSSFNLPPGFSASYDYNTDSFYYVRELDDGMIMYGYGNSGHNKGAYVTNDGIVVTFGTTNEGGNTRYNYFLEDGSVKVNSGNFFDFYDMDYYEYSDAISQYQDANKWVSHFEQFPPKNQTDTNRYNHFKNVLEEGAVKNKALEFFNKFESDYIKDGVISKDAPPLMSEIYNNLDKDTLTLNKDLTSADSFPEMRDNFEYMLEEFEPISCNGDFVPN